MMNLRFVVWMFLAGVMVIGAGVVSGQDYPNKPIRMVTSEPGGGTDIVARLIAQGISGGLEQNLIVENRPTILAGEFVAKMPPDGYTLLVAGSIFWIGPLLQKVPYDPVRDFSPISLTDGLPQILVVHPSVPVKSVKELIALAKARPGELNYGSSGTGSPTHLSAELFKAIASVNIVRINYKGAGPALNGLLVGEVQAMFINVGSAMPHVKSGRLRALGVTSAQPSVLLPGVPTVMASGLTGYESVARHGVFAPVKTPAAIINRLNQEIVRFLNRPDVKEKFFTVGLEVVGSSPEQFAAYIKSDMTRLGKVIKDAGIKVE